MFGFEKVNLTFSINAVWFVIAFLLLAGYTFYIYRYTVPQVRPFTKIALVTLRIFALTAILFFIFEPVLTLTSKTILQPVHLFFIDNSRSIKIDDGTNREVKVKQFTDNMLNSNVQASSGLYIFGNKVETLSGDSIRRINFNEGSTNFSNIIASVKKDERNIASITIVSDGVVTSGAKPVYEAEKLNIPIFTVGLGDTTVKKDIRIRNVLYNEFIYIETPTTILAEISSNGFESKQVITSLFENDVVVGQKNIVLSGEGFQSINFEYKPQKGGEKRMAVTVTTLPEEENTANNKKTFYINVLDNKLKVLLISGAPSNDLSFIRSSLQLNKNISINSITVYGQNKILEGINTNTAIDSADILFLIGFPSKQTPQTLLQKTIDAVNNKDKPFFFLIENSTDYEMLKQFRNSLSFSIQQNAVRNYEVQPNINAGETDNPLLKNNAENSVAAWNSLPPVFQPPHEFKAKPGSNILSDVRINNVPVNRPLILTRRISNSRSISVLAYDIWKWKLQTSSKNLNLFDSFIQNSIQWLNTGNEQKQVRISTYKKLYSLGETVEFTAQVYNETFNPVSDAEVRVTIKGRDKSEILLNPRGSGLYEGSFNSNTPGDYSYEGTAKLNNRNLGSDRGSFNIGAFDVEKIEDRMDYEFLNSLSEISGGKFYFAGQDDDLFFRLKNISEHSSKEKITIKELSLWANEWMMIAAILFFSVEWFIRKRAGML